jgi:hypothetical protein
MLCERLRAVQFSHADNPAAFAYLQQIYDAAFAVFQYLVDSAFLRQIFEIYAFEMYALVAISIMEVTLCAAK